MSEETTSRRGLVKAALGAAAFGAAVTAAREAAAACGSLTPQQTEGPFYPVRSQADTNWDLTQVEGRNGRALGDVILLVGQVTDQSCNPIEGVLVEIWQACASGRYNHPGDTSGLALDPNFQYWGRVLTDAQGRYVFKTIIPGDYPADATWQRPPHIHLKATKRGFRELTTQMYFEGNELNASDAILNGIPATQRSSVVIAVEAARPADGLDEKFCRFDLGLRRP